MNMEKDFLWRKMSLGMTALRMRKTYTHIITHLITHREREGGWGRGEERKRRGVKGGDRKCMRTIIRTCNHEIWGGMRT
jgi:hypothetical protein